MVHSREYLESAKRAHARRADPPASLAAVRQRVQAIALRSREASPEAEKGSRRTATNQRHVRFPGNQGYTFEQNPVLFDNSSTGCDNTRPPQIAEADIGE